MDGLDTLKDESVIGNIETPKLEESPLTEKDLLINSLTSGDIHENILKMADVSNEEKFADNPEIVAKTFAEAQARPKGFSDKFIAEFLDHNLHEANGEKAILGVKGYLDNVMPDKEEEAIGKSPEQLAELHRQAADMIANNLKIGTLNADDATKQYLRGRKNDYIERLSNDSVAVGEMLMRHKAGDKKAIEPTTFEYRGLNVATSDGGEKDLSDLQASVSGVRANIRIQREIAGQFIHWDTDQTMQKKLQGEKLTLAKRIYLNPRTPDLIPTFTTIMQEMNQKGIAAQGKVLDRSSELSSQLRADKPRQVRADSIVLYVQEADGDGVLQDLLTRYQSNPAVFADRQTPKIPTRVAPGIAVGVEPIQSKGSLTSSRAELIEHTKARTLEALTGTSIGKIPIEKRAEAVGLFRKNFESEALDRGIDPNNMAFNKAD